MLNKEKHQMIMGKILKDIYSDARIAPFLGFKGGTCAYFFYGLGRFSVDLDFDLLEQIDERTTEIIFKTIKDILAKYGKIKQEHIKKHTIFFLLSYGELDRNIKIEINTRLLIPEIRKYYEVREYLGTAVLIGKKDYSLSCKILALIGRKELATRDVYDIWYFLEKNWEINEYIINTRTKKSVKENIEKCVEIIEKIKDAEILRGLADLLSSEKEKDWVKIHLRKEILFLLKNYMMASK